MTAAVATALTIDYGHAELLPVHFDDLDPMGMIHNARYALLIERALATFWRHHGHTFSDGRPTTADAFNVVKEFTISYRAPIRGPGDVVVHFWLEHMGTSCAVYPFCLLSSDGTTVFAEGRRVVIKLDRETLRPSPWTPEARAVAEGLLRRPGHAQSRAADIGRGLVTSTPQAASSRWRRVLAVLLGIAARVPMTRSNSARGADEPVRRRGERRLIEIE